MKRLLATILILTGCYAATTAQATSQTDKEREERAKKDADFDRRIDNLRNVGKVKIVGNTDEEVRIYQSKIKPLYRKPNQEEFKLLAPDQKDLQMFSEFLSDKNTGIAKLIIDKGCDSGAEIVVSTPHCLKYTMPGAGASYSFRTENYQNKSLGDLNFTGDRFETPGVIKQGILVSIGDIPLDKIDLKTKELSVLAGFTPTDDFTKASAFSAMLEKGIDGGNLVYKSNAPVMENTTYALRSIAYRGEFMKSIDGMVYDEFGFDDRKDIIVVFRVVRLVPDESVTIIWKELSRKKSPKMEIKKN